MANQFTTHFDETTTFAEQLAPKINDLVELAGKLGIPLAVIATIATVDGSDGQQHKLAGAACGPLNRMAAQQMIATGFVSDTFTKETLVPATNDFATIAATQPNVAEYLATLNDGSLYLHRAAIATTIIYDGLNWAGEKVGNDTRALAAAIHMLVTKLGVDFEKLPAFQSETE